MARWDGSPASALPASSSNSGRLESSGPSMDGQAQDPDACNWQRVRRQRGHTDVLRPSKESFQEPWERIRRPIHHRTRMIAEPRPVYGDNPIRVCKLSHGRVHLGAGRYRAQSRQQEKELSLPGFI